MDVSLGTLNILVNNVIYTAAVLLIIYTVNRW